MLTFIQHALDTWRKPEITGLHSSISGHGGVDGTHPYSGKPAPIPCPRAIERKCSRNARTAYSYSSDFRKKIALLLPMRNGDNENEPTEWGVVDLRRNADCRLMPHA